MAPSLPSNLVRGGEGLTPTFTFTNATPFNTGAALTYTIQVSTQTDFSNVAEVAGAVGAARGCGVVAACEAGQGG